MTQEHTPHLPAIKDMPPSLYVHMREVRAGDVVVSERRCCAAHFGFAALLDVSRVDKVHRTRLAVYLRDHDYGGPDDTDVIEANPDTWIIIARRDYSERHQQSGGVVIYKRFAQEFMVDDHGHSFPVDWAKIVAFTPLDGY